MNECIENVIGDLFSHALKFADTKKDRDLIKGLFATATSTNFVAKLSNVKNKTAIAASKHELEGNLFEYEDIERTSRTVRNDMTNEQQRRLHKRIVVSRKNKEFRKKFDARGRLLKAEMFPELAHTLESIFVSGDKDIGGGLESHSRLTTDILYRSNDNNLFMRQAREIILQVAPPNFSISLSSCYNYTDSYKDNSAAAKRHHAGKNINARISLKRPPRDTVSQLVINLHWSTKAVNLMLEEAKKTPNNCMIDSKDAKAIVSGDIQPVQYPGKSWKPIAYEDHTFDQSRVNAVVPMTHLFLDSNRVDEELGSNENGKIKEIAVTRTGKAVTLIYLGISEPETTFRAMNEIFYLLTLPSLDSYYRNTGRLKGIFTFIVDNGHGEHPDSPLTQMCLARLLNFLELAKIKQRSFAEYHSKRNFVERVHATENEALSRHGAFSSKKVHANADSNSPEHIENMEAMAEDVRKCISCARFGDSFISCFRGIAKNVMFDDEFKLKEFLDLNEERKLECDWTYTPLKNEYLNALVMAWEVDETYVGSYSEDYKLITNHLGTATTANKDKYGTTLLKNSCFDRNSEVVLQPIPDYIRWVGSTELHFLSYEKTEQLATDMPDINDCNIFLPTRILDIFFDIENDPSDEMLNQLALLSWLPINEVTNYFSKQREKAQKNYRDNVGRETWRKHPLYKLKMDELEQKCKANNVAYKGPKYSLVKALAVSQGENILEEFKPEYKGDLDSLPKNMSMLKKLPIATLQYILKYHNLSVAGKKDSLVLRVFLLRNRQSHLTSYMQVREMQELIKLARSLILYEMNYDIIEDSDLYRKRKFPGKSLQTDSKIPVPHGISRANLETLFEILSTYLQHKVSFKTADCVKESMTMNETASTSTEYEDYFEIGVHLKIMWTRDEVGDSGWKPGWYSAEVQSSSIENDEITVVYITEPDCVYAVEVTPLLAEGKLRL